MKNKIKGKRGEKKRKSKEKKMMKKVENQLKFENLHHQGDTINKNAKKKNKKKQ